MGKIILKNIRIYAYHGCLIEEGHIGSDYSVDLKAYVDLKPSAVSDNLKNTVDYVLLHNIIKQEMEVRSKLLETVAQRILNRIFKETTLVNKVSIKISKINPPIGGDVEMVTIEMKKVRV
ncbi:MAG: dihydroneopterin aldolase [Flavobacteriaceae bacterium]|nr:dihydroneopterin aldolase [Flavobacteriaceae bacterium]